MMRIDLTDSAGKTVFVRELTHRAGLRESFCAAHAVARNWEEWADGETAWFEYNPLSDRVFGASRMGSTSKVGSSAGEYVEKINLLGIQTQGHSEE